MVKFFAKRKKEEIKEESFADGRIIITDFRKLKKENFPTYESGDMFFLHYDGKIYLDSEDEANETVITVWKMLAQFPKAELRRFERGSKKRFPNIKTVEDLAKLEGDDEAFMNALAMFLIPAEIKSREAQRAYYGIV